MNEIYVLFAIMVAISPALTMIIMGLVAMAATYALVLSAEIIAKIFGKRIR